MTRSAEHVSAGAAPVVLDAFVSYSRRDAPRVMEIVQAARGRGRTLWVDADDIPPGAPWRTELGTAIEAANAVICCVSPAWLASEECRREYRRAVELGKRLIPLQIAPVDDPPAALGALQWIPANAASSPDELADAVLAAIDTDAEHVREHTHWLSRALRWDGRARDRSLLLRGRDLRAAEDWMARQDGDPAPVPLQAQFVADSRAAERRRLRTTVAVTSTALVLTVALAITAVVQWREAVSQRDQAQSRALAAAALSQLDVDPERSLLLARAARDSATTDQAVLALRTSLDRSWVRARMAAHPQAVSGVAWSSDGRTVISAGRDGNIAAWDASAGAPHGRVVLGTRAVTSLEAATDAAVGIAADEGGRLVVWGLDGMGTLVQHTELTSSGVTTATISGDGRIVAAGTADGTTRLWAATGTELPHIRWTTSEIQSVALSADGATVLLGTTDGAALVGPTTAAAPTRSILHTEGVSTTQLSTDGNVALTAGADAMSVLRVSDGAKTVPSTDVAFQAAMDPKAQHVVVADAHGGVALADAGERWTTLLTRGPVGLTASFSPDGALVQVGRSDGVISIWRVADRTLLVDLRGGRDMALRAAFSPDGQRLVSGFGDGEVRVWALPERQLPLPVGTEPGSTARGTSVAFTPDGRRILTAARDGYVRMWDAHTAAEMPSGPSCTTPPAGPHCLGRAVRTEQGDWITRVRYSPDGTLVATSGQNGTAVVWDAATAVEVARVPLAQDVVDALAFSVDGSRLAVADHSGRVRVVDPRTGQVRTEFRDGDMTDDTSIYALAFTPDGHLLTGGGDGVVRLWDTERRTNRILARTDGVFDVAVDAAGGTAAVAGDSAVVLLDLVGERAPRTLAGHSGFVSGVAFTPDGAMAVTGGQDGTVRVWEVATGQQATAFDVPGGDVNEVAVDNTGRRIAAVSDGGAGTIFECHVCGTPDELAALAAQHSTRELTAEERTSFGLPPSG